MSCLKITSTVLLSSTTCFRRLWSHLHYWRLSSDAVSRVTPGWSLNPLWHVCTSFFLPAIFLFSLYFRLYQTTNNEIRWRFLVVIVPIENNPRPVSKLEELCSVSDWRWELDCIDWIWSSVQIPAITCPMEANIEENRVPRVGSSPYHSQWYLDAGWRHAIEKLSNGSPI